MRGRAAGTCPTTKMMFTMPSRFADAANLARLEMLTRFNPALMWMCNTEAQCTYLSRAWLEFTGRSWNRIWVKAGRKAFIRMTCPAISAPS